MKKQLIFVFLVMVISASQAFAHEEDCAVYSVDETDYSEVSIDDDGVYGYSSTELDVNEGDPPSYCTDYEFEANITARIEGPNVQDTTTDSQAGSVVVQFGYVEEEEGLYCVAGSHGYAVSYNWNDHSGINMPKVYSFAGSETSECVMGDSIPESPCNDYDVQITPYSEVGNDDGVWGYSSTEIDPVVYAPEECTDYEFNAEIDSRMVGPNINDHQVDEGNSWMTEVFFGNVPPLVGTYCVTSKHNYGGSYIWYYNGEDILGIITGENFITPSEACLTIYEPTPTPTPTPTPPCFTCQDIQATIGAIEVIEKNNVIDVLITVSNATDADGNGLTTTFSLRTDAGTGLATFENGSTSVSFSGNVMNQNLRIKGVTESSQVDNIIIEAKYTTRVLKSDMFTVATISTLEFVEFDATYKEIDDNPGNGITDSDIGKRIFPDKLNVADVGTTTDRSLVKIVATISPAIPNAKVNFRTYDLDDPSATATPIDTTGSSGDDNNGGVNDGTTTPRKAGLLSGTGCTTSTDRLKDCLTDSSGIYQATLKTTMQPGDNFAIVASLTDDYLTGITFNSTDGTKLVDSTNKAIPISGARNSDNVQAIRTQMLTVWRSLHIEVDSMGQAHENYVRGNISGSNLLSKGQTKTLNVTAADLEINRFEKGRLELATIANFMDVISNTGNTVTVKNSTSNDIVLANGVNFQVLNQGSTRSALGSIPTGQTITPMQTVTLNISSSVPLETNLFSNGSIFITPTLTSLTVKSNTINSVEVTNNNRLAVSIKDATYFRLYDDDDMDDNAPPAGGGRTLVDGDEGDDVAESNLDLIQPNQTLCVASPLDGKVLGQCNAFLSAYVVPDYAEFQLSGSHTSIPFQTELTIANAVAIYNNPSYFNNLANEANSQFWTVYILGAYQDAYTLSGNRGTGDPIGSVTWGRAEALRNGRGLVTFVETNRPVEYDVLDIGVRPPGIDIWRNRPIESKYNTLHELGHLFDARHEDCESGGIGNAGVMRQFGRLTRGVFCDETIFKIRGGTGVLNP
jgi:hypothetical protein